MTTTPHRRFKDAIYEQLARLGKAVAAPKRPSSTIAFEKR